VNNQSKAFLFKLSFAVVIGTTSGWLIKNLFEPDNKPTAHYTADFNSSSDESAYNDQDFPCPSAEEAAELFKRVRFKPDEPSGYVCDDSKTAKLGRILFKLENLQMELPSEWGGVTRPALEDPISYINKWVQQLQFDKYEPNAIAYNVNKGTTVFLGARFFEIHPLFAIAVLMHEVRHSDREAPSHVACLSGDIPKTSGGCDETLSWEPDSGAYSFGIFFEIGLALYAQNISEDERDFLKAHALGLAITRINNLPNPYVTAVEVLGFIDEAGAPYIIHPITQQIVPVPRKDPIPFLDKVVFNQRNFGLLFFNSKDRARVWEPLGDEVKFWFDKTVPEDYQAVIGGRFYSPSSTYSERYLINTKGEVSLIKVDPKKGTHFLDPLYNQPLDEDIYPLEMFTALENQIILLDREGEVFRFRYSRVHSLPRAYEKLTDSFLKAPWDSGNGGLVYDILIGVEKQTGSVQKLLPNDVFLERASQFDFQGNNSIQDFYELLSGQYFLKENGEIFKLPYGSNEPISISDSLPRVKSLGHFRVPHASDSLFSDSNLGKGNREICDIDKPILEPWFGKAAGINTNGEIVFQGWSNQCFASRKLFEQYGAAESINITGFTPHPKQDYSADISVEIKFKNGKEARLQPYELGF
jgi:hypothetical protein